MKYQVGDRVVRIAGSLMDCHIEVGREGKVVEANYNPGLTFGNIIVVDWGKSEIFYYRVGETWGSPIAAHEILAPASTFVDEWEGELELA